ncbi:helix-turn-helix transcriptional regulator [Variovorax boronicumulans]|uniref:helix-turn-helix transcriptional regulator n=1 Tax=Variovorax boronicumulans TaxID=436515 RepID=UPI00339AA990
MAHEAADTEVPLTRQLPSGLRLRVFAAKQAAPVDCAGMVALFVRAGEFLVDGMAITADQSWHGPAQAVRLVASSTVTPDAVLIDTPGDARFGDEPGDEAPSPIDAESAVALERLISLSTRTDAASTLGCHFEAMRLLTMPAMRATKPAAPDGRVLRAASILRSRMQDPPSLEALAREVGLSPAALKRAFPAAFGSPPYAWLRRERLIEARRLIEQTARPIADIAHSVGLAAGGHFAAACRELFGMEPRALREAVHVPHGAAWNTARELRRE